MYLFDDQVEFVGECVNSSQVKGVFETYQPRGTTKLDKCLNMARKEYSGTQRPNYKVIPGTTYTVILDGTADNNEGEKTVLHHFADPANGYIENHTQIAVRFIQIDDCPDANQVATRIG